MTVLQPQAPTPAFTTGQGTKINTVKVRLCKLSSSRYWSRVSSDIHNVFVKIVINDHSYNVLISLAFIRPWCCANYIYLMFSSRPNAARFLACLEFLLGVVTQQCNSQRCGCKLKLATIVEGNPKAPFSIATTPMCRGGRYSFPGLLYFTLDPYLIMLSAKQGIIKYHFLSLWYDSTWDWTQVSRAIGEHSNP